MENNSNERKKHVMTYDYSNTKLKKILKISFMKKKLK